jgi:ABC-type uncharacterized transport system ATPase subunit
MQIQIKHVKKVFKDKEVLKDISFTKASLKNIMEV